MSKNNNQATGDDKLELIQNSLSKTERFIEDNKKSVSIIIGAIILIIVGYMSYQKFYVTPLEQKAQDEMFMAQNYFAMDSFKIALEGDGNSVSGFLQISEDYSITKTGSLAHYYAGICYLNLGEFDKAIAELESFDAGDEMITSMAIAAIGDAYVEKGNVKDAISYFKKASERKTNEFLTPVFLMKLGLAYENLGQKDEAIKTYETIKTEFPKSNEARKIEKYITRLKI